MMSKRDQKHRDTNIVTSSPCPPLICIAFPPCHPRFPFHSFRCASPPPLSSLPWLPPSSLRLASPLFSARHCSAHSVV